MFASTIRCAILCYLAQIVWSQARIEFSDNPAFVANNVTLKCSFWNNVSFTNVTVNAYDGGSAKGFLNCYNRAGNETRGSGVFSGLSFVGCPNHPVGSGHVTIYIPGPLQTFQLNYTCDVTVRDTQRYYQLTSNVVQLTLNRLRKSYSVHVVTVFTSKILDCSAFVPFKNATYLWATSTDVILPDLPHESSIVVPPRVSGDFNCTATNVQTSEFVTVVFSVTSYFTMALVLTVLACLLVVAIVVLLILWKGGYFSKICGLQQRKSSGCTNDDGAAKHLKANA